MVLCSCRLSTGPVATKRAMSAGRGSPNVSISCPSWGLADIGGKPPWPRCVVLVGLELSNLIENRHWKSVEACGHHTLTRTSHLDEFWTHTAVGSKPYPAYLAWGSAVCTALQLSPLNRQAFKPSKKESGKCELRGWSPRSPPSRHRRPDVPCFSASRITSRSSPSRCEAGA